MNYSPPFSRPPVFAKATTGRPVRPNGCSERHQSKAKLLLTTSWLILAGASHAAPILTEGFNSGFTSPYGGQTFSVQFGVTGPGIVADGNNGTVATEGDSFAGANTDATNTAPIIIGAMDISMGIVSAADVGKTLTFTGDFGWRFGTAASADDLAIHPGQTGFRIGNVSDAVPEPGTTVKDSFSNFDIGTQTENVFEQASFSYTIANGDIGEAIHLRIRLVDSGGNTGLTQLLTDNWVVTAVGQDPPAIASISVSGNTATLTMTGNDAVPYYCASSVDLADFTTEETALVTGTSTPLASPFNTNSGSLTFDVDITGRTDRLFFRIQDSDPNP